MATDRDIPRPGDDGLGLSEAEMNSILDLVAENLTDAEIVLDKMEVGSSMGVEAMRRNRALAAVAQAHSQQAQSLSLYLLLCSRIGD